jgi:hypothetical protein
VITISHSARNQCACLTARRLKGTVMLGEQCGPTNGVVLSSWPSPKLAHIHGSSTHFSPLSTHASEHQRM